MIWFSLVRGAADTRTPRPLSGDLAPWAAKYAEEVAFTKRSSTATPDGYAEYNNFADYLADTLKAASCFPGAALAVDEMDAVGDKVFIKYRFFADPIPPAPNGYDSYFLSVFHLDPAGSGLVVGNDEWIDNIAAEPYVGVYPYMLQLFAAMVYHSTVRTNGPAPG